MLAAPTLAIAFGVFMFCAETCLHADTLLNLSTDWPGLPIHDWIAAGFLIAAGIASRRDWNRKAIYQALAWAFMLSLLVGALFAWFEEWMVPPDTVDWFSEGTFVVLVIILTAIAFGGLVSTLANRQRT